MKSSINRKELLQMAKAGAAALFYCAGEQ